MHSELQCSSHCVGAPWSIAAASDGAVCRGIFGDTCNLERVREELLSYSDYGLHRFALNQGSKFADFLLDPEHLMDSAKCRALSELLPKLRVGAWSSMA